MPDQRGYVICTLPRSGSNFFCEVLTSTGALGRPREYFNTEARRRYDDPGYPDDVQGQIGQILLRGMTANGVYGLKMFPGLHDIVARQVRWADHLPNLTFIRFRRRDILGQAISWVTAAQTGKFRHSDETIGASLYDADAIAVRVRQLAQRNARWDMFFARNGLDETTIYYEDLIGDPDAAIAIVGTLMDLTEPPVIKMDRVAFQIQRDAESAIVRQRFIDERGDPNVMDGFA